MRQPEPDAAKFQAEAPAPTVFEAMAEAAQSGFGVVAMPVWTGEEIEDAEPFASELMVPVTQTAVYAIIDSSLLPPPAEPMVAKPVWVEPVWEEANPGEIDNSVVDLTVLNLRTMDTSVVDPSILNSAAMDRSVVDPTLGETPHYDTIINEPTDTGNTMAQEADNVDFVGFDAAATQLATRGYGFQANHDEGLIHWIESGSRANYDGYVDWAADGARAAAYAYLAEKIPNDLRPAMAAFVCRANWVMVWGNLDFDLDAGRLRVRKTVADAANLAAVEAACDAAMAEMERLHPLVMGVIYGGLSMDEALARVQALGA